MRSVVRQASMTVSVRTVHIYFVPTYNCMYNVKGKQKPPVRPQGAVAKILEHSREQALRSKYDASISLRGNVYYAIGRRHTAKF